MTPEERELLRNLCQRVKASASQPRDPEADDVLGMLSRAQPQTVYVLAQAVLVQEQALKAADEQLQALEARIHELESGTGTSFLGNVSRSLFGGAASATAQSASRTSVPISGGDEASGARGWGQTSAPPQQHYGAQTYAQPQPQPGPWGQTASSPSGGGGFLKGALGAAAGVAGGVLLADSIRGLFGQHNNPAGIGTGFSPDLPADDMASISQTFERGQSADQSSTNNALDSQYNNSNDADDSSWLGGGSPDDGSSWDNGSSGSDTTDV